MEAKKYKSSPDRKQKPGEKTGHRAQGKTDQPLYANIELQTALDELESHVLERSRKLQMIREETRQASRGTSEFLSHIGHKIRPATNSVIDLAGRLLETDLDASQKTYAQAISQSGSSLLRSVDNALELSRVEAGLAELKKESFNLERMVKNVIAQVSEHSANKQISFSLNYNPKLPAWFAGDSGKICLILTGVVENAITSTNKGELGIYVDGVLNKKTVDLRFQVREAGTNNTSAHENYPGGLGMVITTRLVDLMGGTTDISFESRTGTTYIVHLTLDISQAPRVDRSGKQQISATETRKLPISITPEISQLIDMDYVNRLKKDFQTGLLKTLLQQYFSDTEQALRDLARAVEKGDFSKTQNLLHLLKGCSANFGASAIVELCDRHRARLKNLEDMTKADVVDLKQTYQGTKNQLLLAANRAL